jgi:hypothetical protein
VNHSLVCALPLVCCIIEVSVLNGVGCGGGWCASNTHLAHFVLRFGWSFSALLAVLRFDSPVVRFSLPASLVIRRWLGYFLVTSPCSVVMHSSSVFATWIFGGDLSSARIIHYFSAPFRLDDTHSSARIDELSVFS